MSMLLWESKGTPNPPPKRKLPPRERRQPSSLPNPPKGRNVTFPTGGLGTLRFQTSDLRQISKTFPIYPWNIPKTRKFLNHLGKGDAGRLMLYGYVGVLLAEKQWHLWSLLKTQTNLACRGAKINFPWLDVNLNPPKHRWVGISNFYTFYIFNREDGATFSHLFWCIFK